MENLTDTYLDFSITKAQACVDAYIVEFGGKKKLHPGELVRRWLARLEPQIKEFMTTGIDYEEDEAVKPSYTSLLFCLGFQEWESDHRSRVEGEIDG